MFNKPHYISVYANRLIINHFDITVLSMSTQVILTLVLVVVRIRPGISVVSSLCVALGHLDAVYDILLPAPFHAHGFQTEKNTKHLLIHCGNKKQNGPSKQSNQNVSDSQIATYCG